MPEKQAQLRQSDSMRWQRSYRADPRAAALADRHYSRGTVGARQFAPPGRFCGLITPEGDAVWVTLWPDPIYTDERYRDAWMCTLFRNESEHLSSELIREALAATRAQWGDPPVGGSITFVDAAEVASQNPGYCFLKAGYVRQSETTKDRGLVVLHLAVPDHPAAVEPLGHQRTLMEAA